MEWRCRGCFSISETRETLIAELDLTGSGGGVSAVVGVSSGRKGRPSKPEIFIHPHRFQVVPDEAKQNEDYDQMMEVGDSGASTGRIFNLQIRPTDTADSGRYFCLVNGERRPWRLYAVAIQVSGFDFAFLFGWFSYIIFD